MEWADGEVWRAVLAHDAARQDGRLRQLLTHLHLVQQLFLRVWRQQSLESAMRTPADFPDLRQLRAWSLPYYPDVGTFVDGLDDAALAKGVTMPWVEAYQARLGRTFSTPTLGETIFQVTSHSNYHRGQVNARLRETGGEPPLVDYIAWVWFGRPEPGRSQPEIAAV